TVDFDLTQLAAVTVFGTDLKTVIGSSQQNVSVSGVVSLYPGGSGTDNVYLPAGIYPVTDRSGNVYGRFTVSATASGALAVTGTTGAAIATGNTIHLDPCKLERVQITANSGIRWDIGNTTFGASYVNDVVALPDGAYTLDLLGPSGFTSTTFSVSSTSGLSATQLPQGAPLVTLALVPCAPVVGPITAPL